MRRAVVRPALRRGLDHQSLAARRDLQRAFVLRDRVVVGLEVRAFRIDDRVRHFAFSNRRHRTSRLDLRGFAFHEPVAAYRYSGLRQRRAIIFLAVRSGGQSDRALLNDQRAVFDDHALEDVRIRNGNVK